VADVGPALVELASAVGCQPEQPDEPEPVTPLAPLGVAAFVPVWRRPWMTMNADTYGSSVLAAIGVGNVFADADERYPATDLDDVAARRPDLVVAPSEPYPFRARHVPELAAVAPTVLVDGQDLFWWGVRTPAAIARLHAALSRSA
jgi:ABC-type Fe3+-hydroxamate transport system substrate-binding protein